MRTGISEATKISTNDDQSANTLLADLNAIFGPDVRQTREAVLDADCLKTLTQMGIDRARALGRGRSFTPRDFMSKLRHAHNDELTGDFRWTEFGSEVGVFFRSVPTVDYMCLDIAPTEKKQRRKKVKFVRVDESKIIKPSRSNNSDEADGQSGDGQTEALTAKMIKKVTHILTKRTADEPIDAFKFLVNPQSFSQSIENIFYTAFAVKQGKVSVELDSSTQLPTLAKVCEPQFEASQGGTVDEEVMAKAVPEQFICSLDMASWRGLCEKYSAIDSEASVIPMRQAHDS